jgi:DUF4097 and DUF4098 domain-containing protein YvlB
VKTAFRLPPGGKLKIATGSGSVRVVAEHRDDVEIEMPQGWTDLEDDVLKVKSKSGSITARCPEGLRVAVGVISGSVKLEGTFASAKVSAVSGSIDVGSVRGNVDVRSVSGSLSVLSCGGSCCLNTKSGRIKVGHVERDLQAATISGTIEAGTGGQGAVEVKTISGSVSLQVPKGCKPRTKFRTLSGRVRFDCPQGDDFDIKVTTLSGSIEIKEDEKSGR